MIASRNRRPRGMTVTAVLLCLMVIALVGSAAIKVALAGRDVVRAQEDRLQAEWLAEAGASRAIARLGSDAGYTGESWSVTRAELGLATPVQAGDARGGADVVIAVERPPGAPSHRRIRVQADYRPSSARHVRHTKQMLIFLEPRKAGDAP